jgi:hypothetical protein
MKCFWRIIGIWLYNFGAISKHRLSTVPGDFKGAVSGKILTGDYIMAQEVQIKTSIFCLALKKSACCAYGE